MIIEYEVVSESDLSVFKTRMNEALGEGWRPHEGPLVSTTVVNGVITPLFTQALVKDVERLPSEEDFLIK